MRQYEGRVTVVWMGQSYDDVWVHLEGDAVYWQGDLQGFDPGRPTVRVRDEVIIRFKNGIEFKAVVTDVEHSRPLEIRSQGSLFPTDIITTVRRVWVEGQGPPFG